MKVLSKKLWAIDIDIDYATSIGKIKKVAGEFGNDIILLSVLPKSSKESVLRKKLEMGVLSELEKVKKQLSPADENKVEIRLEYGNIADKILYVAEKEDVNVIFLNKGREGTLGENTLKVFQKSRKPVTILSEVEATKNNHIVCPVDFSEESVVALKSAFIHAKKISAKLSVVSVYEPIRITSPRLIRLGLDEKEENENRLKNFEKRFDEFISRFDFSEYVVDTKILEGKPDEEIIKYCQSANILYVGRTNKKGIRKFINGSVSENVIKAVNCNIVSLKAEEVFKLRIPAGLADIDKHYKRGLELIKLGFLHDAVNQFKAGLQVNDLHLPSMLQLSRVLRKLGDVEQSAYYEDLSQLSRERMMNWKIEEEIRRNIRTVS